ncbi:hypothetical protein ZWY2020_051185 [Hordeum vulgare]|nr:hypothetical protein ZWY2020_051185 [Hordeum vulgare]
MMSITSTAGTPLFSPPVSRADGAEAAAEDGGAVDSSEQKSMEIMRKFSEQYDRRSSTFFCSDKSVTTVVIKALRRQGRRGGLRLLELPVRPHARKILLFVVAKESSKFLPILKETAKSFKGKVFGLSVVKRSDFVRYGLGCLERLGDQGDNCAKDIHANFRIMVRG